jgi:hypothetical protein
VFAVQPGFDGLSPNGQANSIGAKALFDFKNRLQSPENQKLPM